MPQSKSHKPPKTSTKNEKLAAITVEYTIVLLSEDLYGIKPKITGFNGSVNAWSDAVPISNV